MLCNKPVTKLSYKNIKIIYNPNNQRRAFVFIKLYLLDYASAILTMLNKRVKLMNIYFLSEHLGNGYSNGATTNRLTDNTNNLHDNYHGISHTQSEILEFIKFFHEQISGYHLHICNEQIGRYTKIFIVEEIKTGKFYG